MLPEPTNYQGNSKKQKDNLENEPEKRVSRVVKGEVVEKPVGNWMKFKNIFFGGDFKSAARYVGGEVLLPAVRNLALDMLNEGGKRVIMGDRYDRHDRRYRPSEYRPKTIYNSSPIRRDPRDPRDHQYYPPDQPVRRMGRREISDWIIPTRTEAERTLEELIEAINKYEMVTVADYYDMLGLPTAPHTDNKWGWNYLNNVQIRQVRDGYVIDMPPAQEI